MEPRKPAFGEKSESVENMQLTRLMALLQELERKHGRKGAADVLGLDHRTLSTSLDEGLLSRRVRSALEQALQEGIGSAADRERERNDSLEQRLESLEGVVEEQGDELRAANKVVGDAVRALREETARALMRLEAVMAQTRTDGSAQGAATAPGDAPGAATRAFRREFPDLVTREPAEDDADVFGDAWPLIVEWRELKDTHPIDGRGLSWLVEHERLLTVELILLEAHGMTLPPETYPLRGLDRLGQTNWRKAALHDARRERARREQLRWVKRVCSLGLWWE